MTATLDNSKKLYELTGWEGTGVMGTLPQDIGTSPKGRIYDSDYLLEKLPAKINHDKEDYFLVLWPSGFAEPELWFAAYTDAYYVDMPFLANTETPADALCLLAIKLKEEGVM